MFDDVVYLIKEIFEKNELEQLIKKGETERKVLCRKDGISRSEFFNAGQNNLNPAFKVTVTAIDYEGEETLKYNEQYYSIYRTYPKNVDEIELYCERKGGVQGERL